MRKLQGMMRAGRKVVAGAIGGGVARGWSYAAAWLRPHAEEGRDGADRGQRSIATVVMMRILGGRRSPWFFAAPPQSGDGDGGGRRGDGGGKKL